jgi:hypothetical protein
MTAIEDLLAKVKPATASVKMCLRGDLMGELDIVNDDLSQYDEWEPSSMSDLDPRVPLLARKRELQEQMRAESQVFSFKSIGDKAWSDLLAAHTAREGNEADESGGFNQATFPVPLVAAASFEPLMTEEQVGQLFDSLTLNQRSTLFMTAYSANVRGVEIPFLSDSSAKTAGHAKKSK